MPDVNVILRSVIGIGRRRPARAAAARAVRNWLRGTGGNHAAALHRHAAVAAVTARAG